uniref:Uncharacterized protein n=1 Tax=Nelumbo nucifera TaxID=4432 RepID=A0A822Z206_NELNU|nr:TPA_asm: hypothetical protein HUJ06_013139 [Nelumbo nucifera]
MVVKRMDVGQEENKQEAEISINWF